MSLSAPPSSSTVELTTTLTMGSLCSKPGTHSGGHTILGSSTSNGQTLLGSSNSYGQTTAPSSPQNETPEERRARMARAAEERIQKDKERLINKSNPNAGRLASQMNKPVKNLPAQQKESEPLRWD